MKNKTKAVWGVALVAGLTVGAISGANAAQVSSGAQIPEGFLSADETITVFNDIDQITDLTLPEGIGWPTVVPKELNEKDTVFEIGYIETTAHLYWLCAWESALVAAPAARGAEGESEELAAVADFTETEWAAESFEDPEGAWTEDVLEPALAGDLSGVEQDFASSCGYYELNQ